MSLESVSRISEITGSDRRTLKKVFEHIDPIIDGKAHLYETKDVLPLIYQPTGSVEGDPVNLDIVKERARLTYHQANIAELDEDVKRGELIPAETVEIVWADMVSSFRAKLLSMPTKSAHEFVSLTDLSEIQDAIKAQVNEALEELADYDPKQYGIKTSASSSK